jgi:four helix bundle protein
MESRDDTREERTRSGSVDRTRVYQLAREASDCAWNDATTMSELPLLKDVAAQLVRAIGSISANIAEGYARRSPRERIRFYEYALGSAEESRAWYDSGRRALSASDLDERVDRLTSIRRLLLTMIRNERSPTQWNSPRRGPP